jgi:hypothetical protein
MAFHEAEVVIDDTNQTATVEKDGRSFTIAEGPSSRGIFDVLENDTMPSLRALDSRVIPVLQLRQGGIVVITHLPVSPAVPRRGILTSEQEGISRIQSKCKFGPEPATTTCSVCRKTICDDHTKTENNVLVCSNGKDGCYEGLSRLRSRG